LINWVIQYKYSIDSLLDDWVIQYNKCSTDSSLDDLSNDFCY
jgi:hypothetical protein